MLPPIILFATPSSSMTYTIALPGSGRVGSALALSESILRWSPLGPHAVVAAATAASWLSAGTDQKIAEDNRTAKILMTDLLAAQTSTIGWTEHSTPLTPFLLPEVPDYCFGCETLSSDDATRYWPSSESMGSKSRYSGFTAPKP